MTITQGGGHQRERDNPEMDERRVATPHDGRPASWLYQAMVKPEGKPEVDQTV